MVYDPTFDISTTNFNQYVINMRNAGVKILFMEQMPQNYRGAVIQALNQQDFHPIIVFGGSTYSEELVTSAGGPGGHRRRLHGAEHLVVPRRGRLGHPRGQDLPHLGAEGFAGFHADLYTLYGWLSAELFSQALKAAGTHPSRGAVLEALRHITSFSGNYLVGTANPADKIPTNCYIIVRIENGKYQRLDDPPLDGPTHGYRCDEPFFYSSG